MRLDQTPGLINFAPSPEDAHLVGHPCGEWRFLYLNGMGAIVARTRRTPGNLTGHLTLSGFDRNHGDGRILALPENPLTGLTEAEAIDWLYHISTLGMNGTSHPSPTLRYPVAYFIHKFEGIAPEGFCRHEEQEAHGPRSVLGWCGTTDTHRLSDEAEALGALLGDPMLIVGVADGLDPRYSRDPRSNILMALREVLDHRNRIRLMSLRAERAGQDMIREAKAMRRERRKGYQSDA
jgi:hypothetical protein